MHTMFMTAVAFSLLLCSAEAQQPEDLVGPVSLEQLLELPGWFSAGALSYRPNADYLDLIPDYLKDVDILCVLGTWCSDSEREVPRMFRIMQIKGISPEKMRMIGVDRDKLSPGGETIGLNIERVPTFIFSRNGEELGRIVESPYASLEKDMLGIIMMGVKDNVDDETEVPTPARPRSPETDETMQEKEGESNRHEPEESLQPR